VTHYLSELGLLNAFVWRDVETCLGMITLGDTCSVEGACSGTGACSGNGACSRKGACCKKGASSIKGRASCVGLPCIQTITSVLIIMHQHKLTTPAHKQAHKQRQQRAQAHAATGFRPTHAWHRIPQQGPHLPPQHHIYSYKGYQL
jgi:hypothetical protein